MSATSARCAECGYDVSAIEAGTACPECGSVEREVRGPADPNLGAFFIRAAMLAAPIAVVMAGLLTPTDAFGVPTSGVVLGMVMGGACAVYLCWYLIFRIRALRVRSFKPHRALDRAAIWGTLTVACLLLARCAA